jgi:hypothetical protein
MTNPMIRIHDLATDKVIDREMTNDELQETQARIARENAKVAQKDALLEKLGITEDEARLLLG